MSAPRSLDDAIIAALSHPTRRALLDELLARDLPRVKDLAEALRIPPNRISFHLRVLSDAGLVVREASTADGRESRWRLRSRTLRLDPSESSRASALSFIEAEHAREAAKLRAAFDAAARHSADPARSFEADIVSDAMALTESQAIDLFRELTGVISSHALRARSSENAEAKTWFVTSYVVKGSPL